MSAVIQAKKQKPLISKSKATFNRLRKSIEKLENELNTVNRSLDECLSIYQRNVQPSERELGNVFKEIVKHLYENYKNDKRLKKKEKETLKNIVLDKIQNIIELGSFNMSEDTVIKEIVEDLENVNFDEIKLAKINDLKDEMIEKFHDEGIDIDLSSFSDEDNQEDIMRKFAEAFARAQENAGDEFEEKPKSKKQLDLEEKEKKLEALQKQGLSGIYKQLAKVLHPDLEQDLNLKKDKEKLMKKLTTAYDNKDLHTLLQLELEWMSGNSAKKEQTEDQLKIFNALLKQQVNELKSEIDMAFENPKYQSIQRYLYGSTYETIFKLTIFNDRLKNDINEFKKELKMLKSGDRTVREIIRSAY